MPLLLADRRAVATGIAACVMALPSYRALAADLTPGALKDEVIALA